MVWHAPFAVTLKCSSRVNLEIFTWHHKVTQKRGWFIKSAIFWAGGDWGRNISDNKGTRSMCLTVDGRADG